MTPHIAGGWIDDPDLFARVFPMDMRPQAHDIIRTWLFGSVVRSHHEHGCLPWAHAAISGWILDPERKKMAKSVGNVVTPLPLLEEYGTDAVRYWAASARPGVDTAFDDGQMKIGRKLGTKLLNASKFVLGFGEPPDSASPTAAIDQAMLARLGEVVDESTRSLDDFDYARALERTEAFFWWFCDDYVELVKGRAYGTQGDNAAHSARAALRQALDVMLRLFAPFVPFVTEEVWSWWRAGSVHSSPWPAADGLESTGDASLLVPVSEVLAAVRRAKTEAKLSQRAAVDELIVDGPSAALAALEACRTDLEEAGGIAKFTMSQGTTLTTTVRLAPSTDARVAH
jgi:valyl-tRNA synthetase